MFLGHCWIWDEVGEFVSGSWCLDRARLKQYKWKSTLTKEISSSSSNYWLIRFGSIEDYMMQIARVFWISETFDINWFVVSCFSSLIGWICLIFVPTRCWRTLLVSLVKFWSLVWNFIKQLLKFCKVAFHKGRASKIWVFWPLSLLKFWFYPEILDYPLILMSFAASSMQKFKVIKGSFIDELLKFSSSA